MAVGLNINNVIRLDFNMYDRPVMSQLTIHINNLINTYDKKLIIKEFKFFLDNPDKLENLHSGFTIKSLILFYGIDTWKEWFSLIYGWNFNKRVS